MTAHDRLRAALLLAALQIEPSPDGLTRIHTRLSKKPAADAPATGWTPTT